MSKKIENIIVTTPINSGGYVEHNLAKKYGVIEKFKYFSRQDNKVVSHEHLIRKYKTLHSAIQAQCELIKNRNERRNSYWVGKLIYDEKNFEVNYKIIT